MAALAYTAAFGPRLAAWIALAGAFAGSRGVVHLATGRVHAVRDALDHVYGLPLDIIRDGHIPDAYVYSAYPALQVILAQASLVTGLQLWEMSGLLAVAFGLTTMALVARTAASLWPGTGVHAGAGFLVAYYGIPPGQLYQPMTLSLLFFAFLVFLVVRDRAVALGPGLFVIGLGALGLTHPYSAFIVGISLFVALVVQAFLGSRVRFLVPLSIVLGIGVIYVAAVGQDLDRFIGLLRFNDAFPVPLPGQGGINLGPDDSGFSQGYLLSTAWAFRLSMAAVLAGWILAVFPRPLRAVFSQVLAGVTGFAYLVSRVVSYGFPVRVLMIATVATGPFIGLALHRARLFALPLVAGLAFLAITSPAATYQYFPWSDEDHAVHALDDPAETADLIAVFLEIEDGLLRRSNPVSSHQVFHFDQAIAVRSFASTDRPGTSLHTHFIFRDIAVEYGHSVGTSQAGNVARERAFEPYPTEGQLALLDSLDRFGSFGSFGLYRG